MGDGGEVVEAGPAADRYEAGRILLGASLRQRRAHAGLTLAGLTENADVSVGYLSDVERARRLPSLDKLDGLAGALGTDVATLLSGVYPPPRGAPKAPRRDTTVADGRGRSR